MEELKNSYYFSDMKACPCTFAFDGMPWDALRKKDSLLKGLKKEKIDCKLPEGVCFVKSARALLQALSGTE